MDRHMYSVLMCTDMNTQRHAAHTKHRFNTNEYDYCYNLLLHLTICANTYHLLFVF